MRCPAPSDFLAGFHWLAVDHRLLLDCKCVRVEQRSPPRWPSVPVTVSGGIQLPSCLPVPIPYASLLSIGARDSRAGSIQSFVVQKPSAIDVAERKMGHPHIVHIPNAAEDGLCRWVRIATNSKTEERQFKAKSPTFGRYEHCPV